MLRRIGPLLALALILRVAFAWLYIQGHPAQALGIIPFLFEPGNIAASIASGHGFSSPFRVETGPTAWMTPVYPLLLAGIFRLFGPYTFHSYLAAASLNILFSTLTCLPIFVLARRVAGERAGLIAALLWAIFPTAIILPYESMWDASLTALLLAAVLCFGSPWLWGFALMTNAALLSILPFVLRRWTLLIVLLCCIPWTLRNYLVLHAFVPLRSAGGVALWLGTRTDFPHPISNQEERGKYVELGEIEYMRQKQSEALAFIVAHPLEEVRLALPRFVTFWTGTNTIQLKSTRAWLVVLSDTLAAIGALAGCILLWRRKSPWAFALTAIPVVFPLIYYLALAPPRYRHPIDPVLLVLTAIAFTRTKLVNDPLQR